MFSELVLLCIRLNLASLASEEKETVCRTGLFGEEAVENFKYRKYNDGYWDRAM